MRGGTATAGSGVRQGVTGIERRSKSEEDGEREVRRTLLESVQGEVEVVTGGRRMTEILAATQEALSELVTATGRPKAGGRYAAAIEDRDRLIAEEQKLSGEVVILREALEKRATAAKRLAELDRADDRQERRRPREAQAAFDAASAERKAEDSQPINSRSSAGTLPKETAAFVPSEKARNLRRSCEVKNVAAKPSISAMRLAGDRKAGGGRGGGGWRRRLMTRRVPDAALSVGIRAPCQGKQLDNVEAVRSAIEQAK